jgi:hypothetical protein
MPLEEKEILKKFGVTKEEYLHELTKAKNMVVSYYNYKLFGRLIFLGYLVIQAYYNIHLNKVLLFPPEFIAFLIIVLITGALDMVRFYFFFSKKHPLRFFLYIQERKKHVNLENYRIIMPALIGVCFFIFIIEFLIVIMLNLPVTSKHGLSAIFSILAGLLLASDYHLFQKAGFKEEETPSRDAK